MKKLLILLLFVAQGVFSQSADELFTQANEKYKSEQYEEAIKLYDQIESWVSFLQNCITTWEIVITN